MKETVQVTRDDREAASDLWAAMLARGPLVDEESGKERAREMQEAFARHRLSATPAPAGVEATPLASEQITQPDRFSIYAITLASPSFSWPEREAVTEDAIDAALGAYVPGGARVFAWLPMADGHNIHQTARVVMRAAIAGLDKHRAALAAAPAPSGQEVAGEVCHCVGLGLPNDKCPECNGSGGKREVEQSWSGDPNKIAAELRRVSKRFNPELLLAQLLRDAADEIDCLTMQRAAPAPSSAPATTPPASGVTVPEGEVERLAERIRAAVTYQYMPMAVRRLLSEAAAALSTPSATPGEEV